MFLFLSKLLPLFLYPLGLTCVLMFVALVLFWKRPQLAPRAIFLGLLVLLLGSNGWICTALVKSLEWQNIPQEIPQAEAIVVLGGGVKPAVYPRDFPDLAEEGDRILYGYRLYQQKKAPLIIVSGGRIEWKGSGESESKDMATILETLGVPSSKILQDPTSLNTYENAVNVRKILEEKKIKKVLLVTSAMHIPRSLLIFKKQGINAIAAPCDFLVTEQDLKEQNATTEAILLNILPDSGRLTMTTKAIKEYIGLLIYKLKGWI
jgi:uncharacterized SAM-binding protein YcdF (DUF218 family)